MIPIDTIITTITKILLLGAITIGVHKKNVSPQNHFEDIILNDHYIYKIIYLIDFFCSLDIHIPLD